MTETTAAIFAALPANLQYVWGLRNVDDLVLRDSDNGGGGNLGISGSGLGLRLYALQNANWNVVALVGTQRRGAGALRVHGLRDGNRVESQFLGVIPATNLKWTRLFAAMDVDPATGLYYANARWYNPSLGVFATTDPALADPNTYRYAGNNPVTNTDPSGMSLPVQYTTPVWTRVSRHGLCLLAG